MVFTDDDVVPPPNWLPAMCLPILTGEADAVAGGIRLASHLRRPWITPAQTSWLASTEFAAPDQQIHLIGANMAISRKVFDIVPRFDEEIGPGALGHADDSLFSFQMHQAGFKIKTLLSVEVEHHLEEDRLFRKAFVRQARKRGEFNAYVDHHWRHNQSKHPYWMFGVSFARLWWNRLKHFKSWWVCPTVPLWELHLLENLHTSRRGIVERHRPRRYARHGLTKLSAFTSDHGLQPELN